MRVRSGTTTPARSAASLAAQRAFRCLPRREDEPQPRLTLMRAAPGKPWLRIEGFVTPDELVDDYQTLPCFPLGSRVRGGRPIRTVGRVLLREQLSRCCGGLPWAGPGALATPPQPVGRRIPVPALACLPSAQPVAGHTRGPAPAPGGGGGCSLPSTVIAAADWGSIEGPHHDSADCGAVSVCGGAARAWHRHGISLCRPLRRINHDPYSD